MAIHTPAEAREFIVMIIKIIPKKSDDPAPVNNPKEQEDADEEEIEA